MQMEKILPLQVETILLLQPENILLLQHQNILLLQQENTLLLQQENIPLLQQQNYSPSATGELIHLLQQDIQPRVVYRRVGMDTKSRYPSAAVCTILSEIAVSRSTFEGRCHQVLVFTPKYQFLELIRRSRKSPGSRRNGVRSRSSDPP